MIVCNFDWLHLDTAAEIDAEVREALRREEHPNQSKCKYHVEGKCRPMLVLCEEGEEIGKRRYLVAKLTSKRENRKYNRQRFMAIGSLPGETIETMVELPCIPNYPERLKRNQKCELDWYRGKLIIDELWQSGLGFDRFRTP